MSRWVSVGLFTTYINTYKSKFLLCWSLDFQIFLSAEVIKLLKCAYISYKFNPTLPTIQQLKDFKILLFPSVYLGYKAAATLNTYLITAEKFTGLYITLNYLDAFFTLNHFWTEAVCLRCKVCLSVFWFLCSKIFIISNNSPDFKRG